MADGFLPGVPRPKIEALLNKARGNEIATGKFDSPRSSAALAANTFGYFLERPEELPPLPGCGEGGWPARSVDIERTVRFPWRGGTRPHLDALVTTPSALIGIESKRYEPFDRGKKAAFSEAYWRPLWGDRMKRYESVRDRLREDGNLYSSLDAAQLVKHAFGLRTEVHLTAAHRGLTPVLFYLYAEPARRPGDGRPVDDELKVRHRDEIESFAHAVAGDEVTFVSCTYGELLSEWGHSESPAVRAHTEAVTQRFSP